MPHLYPAAGAGRGPPLAVAEHAGAGGAIALTLADWLARIVVIPAGTADRHRLSSLGALEPSPAVDAGTKGALTRYACFTRTDLPSRRAPGARRH
ncbi:hypothetical protein ACTMU2_00865 [Cupriavidus basilensis]